MKIIACSFCGEVLDGFVYGIHASGIYCLDHAPLGTRFFGNTTSERVKRILVDDCIAWSPQRYTTKSHQRFTEYALHLEGISV